MYNTLNTKVNNLEKKITDESTLIQTSQCNKDDQDLENKTEDFENEMPDTSGLLTTTVLNTEIGKVENKLPDTSCWRLLLFLIQKLVKLRITLLMLVIYSKNIDYNVKISDIEEKYLTSSNYNKFTN